MICSSFTTLPLPSNPNGSMIFSSNSNWKLPTKYLVLAAPHIHQRIVCWGITRNTHVNGDSGYLKYSSQHRFQKDVLVSNKDLTCTCTEYQEEDPIKCLGLINFQVRTLHGYDCYWWRIQAFIVELDKTWYSPPPIWNLVAMYTSPSINTVDTIRESP